MQHRRSASAGLLALVLLVSCSTPERPVEKRARLEQVGPVTVRVLPAEGQLPYCLLFTTSERGVIRQLTMGAEGKSVPCKAGEPIGGVTYRIPTEEGKVRIYLLFSGQELEAKSMAQQIHELATTRGQFTAMDLRAPGQVQLETLDFTPSAAPGTTAP